MRKLGVVSGFNIVKCSNCHLAYVENIPSYSELEKIYSEQKLEMWQKTFGTNLDKELDRFTETTNNETKDWFDEVLEYVDGSGNDTKSILEIGSSRGVFLNYANSKGYDAFGTEASEDIVNKVRKHVSNRIYFVKEDNYDSCFHKQTFDFIYMEHVLEHMRSPHTVLRSLAKLLNNNGKIMIIVPNHSCVAAQLIKLNWYAYDPPIHLFFYNMKSISHMLKNCGFSIENIRSFSSYRRVGRVYTLDKYFNKTIKLINKIFKTNINTLQPFNSRPANILDFVRLLPFYIVQNTGKILNKKNYGEELVLIAKKI